MGASKNEFMNIRMSKESYFNVPEEHRLEMEVKNVDVDNFDYSGSDLWNAQKKVSDKEYRKLKKIEFEIRNK